MRNLSEPIEGWRFQAAVYQQGVMMAYKRKADHPNRLEDPRVNYREPFTGVTFQFWWDVWALDDNGYDDYEHADEGKPGCAGQFMDVAVERERIRDAYCAKRYYELTIGEYGENRYRV
jgi:hypothetical protein